MSPGITGRIGGVCRAHGLVRESADLGAEGDWAGAERRALAAHQMAPLAYGPREALFRAARETCSPYFGPAALAASSHPDAPASIRIEALDAVLQAGHPQIFLHLYRTLPIADREQDETVLRVIDFLLLTRQTPQVRALVEACQARGKVDRRFTAKMVRALLQSPVDETSPEAKDDAEAHRLVAELATDRDDLFRAALGEFATLKLSRLRPDLLPGDVPEWLETQPEATVDDRLLAAHLRLAADPEPAREARMEETLARFRESEPEKLAAWLFRLDRPDGVLDVIDEVRGRHSRELYILRLRALERADPDGKEAEAMLAWLEEPHPDVDRADVLVTQAACHFRLGRRAEALTAWEEVLGLAEVDPGHHPIAKLYLLALSQEQLDLAARLLLQAARCPGPTYALPPGGALAPVLAHLQQAGRMGDLRTLTEALLRREEDNPVLRNNFAYLCFLFGQNVDEALAISEELVARNPNAVSFRTTLALGRLAAGETALALDALSAPGLDWNMAGPADHAIRAAALERNGRTAEAGEARRSGSTDGGRATHPGRKPLIAPRLLTGEDRLDPRPGRRRRSPMSREDEAAALRMTAAAALRRLGQIAEGPGCLHVDAAPDILFILEDEARSLGWELVPPGKADFVIRIGPRRPEPDLEAAFEVVARFPRRTYRTLNAWFARHPWAARIPDGGRSRIAATWDAWGLDVRVGTRVASFPCPDEEELYLVRRGTPVLRSAGMSAADRCRDLVATCGGLGHVPLVGANLASLWPVLAAYATWWVIPAAGDFRLVWGGVAFLASVGCLATEQWAQRHFFAQDPREVVVDETAGMAVTLLFLPDGLRGASAGTVAAAFALAFLAFRFFDVFKLGVRWIDRRSHLPGGVLWDDLLAGVYAGLVTAAMAGLLLSGPEPAGP